MPVGEIGAKSFMKGIYGNKLLCGARKNKANSKPICHSYGTGFYRIGGAWNKPTLAIVEQRREFKILIRTFFAAASPAIEPKAEQKTTSIVT